MFKRDPGPCSICGAAHTACTGGPSGGGPVHVAVMTAGQQPPPLVQPLEADRIQATLPEGAFTSAHYSRDKHGPTPKRK